MNFTVVIPARHASTRLPGKMLLDLGGRPMVVRVAERARLSSATDVVVATDHPAIAAAVSAAGIRVLNTRVDHASGTDRIAEAAQQLGFADDAIVVNVQGDEPLIDPALVDTVAILLAERPQASIATAARPIVRLEDFLNPNIVKVVCDAQGLARYFSRAPIPFPRDGMKDAMKDATNDAMKNAGENATQTGTLPAGLPALHHIGIYAYRAAFLREFGGLAQSPAERFEALEQLRALHHGHAIAVRSWTGVVEAGVDTEADLLRVRAHFGHSAAPRG